MNLKNKSIVVLLSGGLDSSTVTGIAKKSEAKIFGLSFDYGQRHKKELHSASIIAEHFNTMSTLKKRRWLKKRR